jgi:hypothetical protein
MPAFDKTKSYTITAYYPNGKIMRDNYGEFNFLSLWNITKKNDVYIGYDEQKRERRFNSRLTIEYFEF